MNDTNPTPEQEMEVHENVVDEISSILSSDDADDQEVVEETSVEEDNDDNVEEDDDDNIEEEDEDEEDGEDDTESNVSWGQALGTADDKVVLNDEGDFEGFKVKVDGQEFDVSTDELLAGYQTSKSYTNKSKALADEKREFESNRSMVYEEYSKKLENVDKLTEILTNSLLRDYESVNWQQLRQENPGEYAAVIQDYQTRKNEIDQIVNATNSERETMNKEQVGEFEKKRAEYIKGQTEILLRNNPTWENQDELKKAFKEMNEFVTGTYGFTEQEFNEIADARIIELIKDAQKYRTGERKIRKQTKKSLPKYHKSSKTRKPSKKTTKLDKLVNAANKSTGASKRELQSSAIAELLMGE